jgi:D-galactose 1-dehydrogenase
VTRILRLGLVGLGKVAHGRHLPAIAGDPRFELAATAGPGGGRVGIPHHADIHALLAAGPALDAVSICTPPQQRAGIAHAAIEAGLQVMLEKPPAVTVHELDALDRSAEAGGATLFAAWHAREAAQVGAAAAWLREREVRAVCIDWKEDIRRWHPGQEWILSAGGFGVLDPGINALSIASAILPGPLVVEAARLQVPERRAMPIAATVHMRSGDAPVQATFDFLQAGAQTWQIAVDTDRGRLLLAEGGRRLDIDGHVGTTHPDLEYARVYRRFAALIDAGQREVDPEPLRLAEDILRVGVCQTVAPFAF